MTQSIARRVAKSGAGIVVATLVVVGVGTGAALHDQRSRDLDDALLAAAHGRAHPEPREAVEVEHSRSPIDTWVVRSRDPRLPDSLVKRAIRSDRPVNATIGDERVVLLPFELEHGDDDGHRLAAAAAPRMTLRRSIGAFALIYLLVATFSAMLATFVLFRLVRRAFAPLDEAREEADRVVSIGDGKRLTESGPSEIRTLLLAINRLLDRLDLAHDAQSRFTAEAAHELRTPVTAMLGELDVAMRNERSADEYRQTLESVREEVVRLSQLVEALTSLARIDAGQIDHGRELVRAAEIAANAAAAQARLTGANDVRISVDSDPELEVHRALVEVALGNLLRNATRHAPGAEVILTVSRSDGLVEYTVDDAGPGIPTTEREALFDRFVRGGVARREDRAGMGLGLPIAREIARRHGGDCTLDESPAGGVRARLTLRTSDR